MAGPIVTGVLMRRLHAADPTPLDLDADLFTLAATLIDLSLVLFPRGSVAGHSSRGEAKLNVLLDLRADVPAFASLHEGDRHKAPSLAEIPLNPETSYGMDRGYLDFLRLHRLHTAGAFLVTRLKIITLYYVVESRPVAGETGLRCDETIRLNSAKSRRLPSSGGAAHQLCRPGNGAVG